MQQLVTGTRWQRWRQSLFFGLPLGLLELALFTLTVTHPAQMNPQQASLIGLLLAFLAPAIAGYAFCHGRRHEGWESGWAGLRVGVVGSVLFLVVVAGWMLANYISEVNTPPPLYSRTIYSPALDLFVSAIILAMLAMLNFVALFIGAAGGRVGGTLAILLAKRLQQSPEHDV